MERLVEFSPAWNKSSLDPKKDYGIGAVNIRFVLKGEHGAVQFVIGTSWYLPKTQRDSQHRLFERDFEDRFNEIQPRGWDLGYHSDKPLHEWQSDEPGPDNEHIYTRSSECKYTPSGRCFYDGSTLNAEPLVEVLLREGSEGVWRELERYYARVFEGGEDDLDRTG